MKTASAALIAMLENSSSTNLFAECDLMGFNLVGGGTIRITNADVDIAYGGQTWLSQTVGADTPQNKATGHWKCGMDVDTWIVEFTPRIINILTGATYPDQIGSQPWLQAALRGALDGAYFQADRAFWPGGWPTPWTTPLAPGPAGYATPSDYVLSAVFAGRVAQIDVTRASALVTINSHLELLTTLMPHNLYQAGCIHQLFDAGCTLVAASFAKNGSVGSVGATANLITSAITAPSGSGTYTLGQMKMTSGGNSGFARQVRSWDSGTGLFTLTAPFPFTINPGDTFTAYPGCDKQQVTCNKFANIANFGGESYIPVPEIAA